MHVYKQDEEVYRLLGNGYSVRISLHCSNDYNSVWLTSIYDGKSGTYQFMVTNDYPRINFDYRENPLHDPSIAKSLLKFAMQLPTARKLYTKDNVLFYEIVNEINNEVLKAVYTLGEALDLFRRSINGDKGQTWA